jgi:hypothetical protein
MPATAATGGVAAAVAVVAMAAMAAVIWPIRRPLRAAVVAMAAIRAAADTGVAGATVVKPLGSFPPTLVTMP